VLQLSEEQRIDSQLLRDIWKKELEEQRIDSQLLHAMYIYKNDIKKYLADKYE
jgi:hypothetical protein